MRAQKRPEMFLEMARRLPGHRFVLVGGSDSDRAGLEYARAIREALDAVYEGRRILDELAGGAVR